MHLKEKVANEPVGKPICQSSYGHGSGSGSLREQLGSDEPWNGARADGKEDDEAEREDDRQVRDPVQDFLEQRKEFLWRKTRLSISPLWQNEKEQRS